MSLLFFLFSFLSIALGAQNGSFESQDFDQQRSHHGLKKQYAFRNNAPVKIDLAHALTIMGLVYGQKPTRILELGKIINNYIPLSHNISYNIYRIT